MASAQLQAAYQLIKTGDKEQAVRHLRMLIKQDNRNAGAWWLLAHALSDPAEVREALTRNLELRPDHEVGRKALAAHNRKFPPASASSEDEEFEQLFNMVVESSAHTPSRPAQKVSVSKPKTNNQAWLLYASVALVILFVCGGIGLILREATSFVGEVASVIDMAQQGMLTDYAGYETVPAETTTRGTVAVGERKTATVDTWVDDQWLLSGEAGQRLTIHVNARDSVLDPEVFIYHPDGYLLAVNDDRIPGDDLNSEVTLQLPDNGRYSIVVSAFGTGGDYELLVQ
jgi:hypothetical protein